MIGFGTSLLQIWSNIADILTRGTTLAILFENFLKDLGFYGNEMDRKLALLVEKRQPLGYPNMSKSRLYLLSCFREKYDYFLQYLDYFCPNRAGSQVKGLESKFDKTYFIHAIPGQLPVKKILVSTFSSFAVIDRKAWIFKFDSFSSYHTYIFEKTELDLLMQSLMLNRLAPISNPKNEKGKSSYVIF